MDKPKFLKRLYPIQENPKPQLKSYPEVFYDMDNDAFFRWEEGHLIKYQRLPKIDIKKYMETWGPDGEDNFYYVGAKDLLEYLIEKGYLEAEK